MNVVVAGSFCFRRSRNEWGSSFHGMTGTRLERHTLFGKGGPNGEEGRWNDLGFTVIPFSVPVVRTTFLVRGSFWVIPKRQELLEWPPNEVKTRRGVGKKSGDFPNFFSCFLKVAWKVNYLKYQENMESSYSKLESCLTVSCPSCLTVSQFFLQLFPTLLKSYYAWKVKSLYHLEIHLILRWNLA